MKTFVIPQENSNVSSLLRIPWFQRVDTKFFIYKKEIHIKDTKKGEVVSQILCSTTNSENTQFQANKKDKVVIDKLFEEKDIENDIENSYSKEELDKKLFDQDFQKFLVMTLNITQNLR